MTFETLGLSPMVKHNLGLLGYRVPTPVQAKAIPLALQGRGYRVAQHRNAGVAVLQLRPRREQDGRFVAGDGEGVIGRVELFPEVAFPAGELVVGQPVLFRVGQATRDEDL